MSEESDSGRRTGQAQPPQRLVRRRGEKEEAPRDGRAARALRTRKAVADALLSLIEDGELRPTSKSIAERAGVSERTIFQHFEDLETLFGVAAGRVGDRILQNLTEVPAEGAFEKRLAIYSEQIAYVHDAMTPIRRASRLHEPFSPALDSALGWLRDTLRKGIERVFEPELAAWSGSEQREVLEVLALLASWSSWENMVRHSGFSPEQARRVLEVGFRAALRQPAVAGAADAVYPSIHHADPRDAEPEADADADAGDGARPEDDTD